MLALVGYGSCGMWNGVQRHEPYAGMGEDRQGEAQHAKNEHNVQATVQRLLIVILVLGCCRKRSVRQPTSHTRDGEDVESKAPQDGNCWYFLEARLTC